MKKLFLLIGLFSILSFGVSAQYYYVPFINDGNPGGLNTDYDDGMLYGLGTWTFIMQDTSGTPVWSPVLSIPFSFDFNGSPVNSFKVSTSAILTFTTNAVAVPAFNNVTLPSNTIPDNSVCVAGLASLGDAATIWTNTFGTAPHRQFWIEFADFQFPGGISTEDFNFWSIVLEESTNNIYIVDQLTYNATGTAYLSLGIQINNTTAYSVAGSPNDTSYTYLAGIYGDSASDNSYYQFIHGASKPLNDIELSSISIPTFKLVPGNINISGTVSNVGADAITSFAVSYQNGANVYTDSIKGVSIATGNSYNFTHDIPFNVANPTTYPIKVWVDLTGDVDHDNDTLSGSVSGLAFIPNKNIVFEESTGTWCGFCPGGSVYMDSLNNTYPQNALLIAVHDYDPMTDVANDTLYDDSLSSLIPGFPSITIDRSYIEGNTFNILYDYSQIIMDTVPVEVSVTTSFNASTRVLTINTSGHFATDLNGDYRFNAVVTEDSVHGTAEDWAQSDYFSSNCPSATGNDPDCTLATQELNGAGLVGEGYNWVTEPDPVPASVMIYNWVERAILAGFRGQSGSLPASITGNNTYQYSFTYTVPAGYDVKNIKVIAWVINASTGQIYNSARANSILGIKEASELASHLFIYPNPSTGMVNVKSTVNGALVVKLNVMNSIGETVKVVDKLSIYNDTQLIDLSSFSNGLYFLQFTDENNMSYVSKIMINR